jgi:hypothetical protein
MLENIMTKLCRGCDTTKNTKEFAKHKNRKDGLQAFCRECNKARSKAYYKRNIKSHRQRTTLNRKQHITEVRQYIVDYLTKHPCVDCGMTDIRTLEFDHVRGIKSDVISRLMYGSIKLLKEEILKCDVRCANCHRIKTNDEFGYFKSVYVNAL